MAERCPCHHVSLTQRTTFWVTSPSSVLSALMIFNKCQLLPTNQGSGLFYSPGTHKLNQDHPFHINKQKQAELLRGLAQNRQKGLDSFLQAGEDLTASLYRNVLLIAGKIRHFRDFHPNKQQQQSFSHLKGILQAVFPQFHLQTPPAPQTHAGQLRLDSHFCLVISLQSKIKYIVVLL